MCIFIVYFRKDRLLSVRAWLARKTIAHQHGVRASPPVRGECSHSDLHVQQLERVVQRSLRSIRDAMTPTPTTFVETPHLEFINSIIDATLFHIALRGSHMDLV